jgi:hypothetical protein
VYSSTFSEGYPQNYLKVIPIYTFAVKRPFPFTFS